MLADVVTIISPLEAFTPIVVVSLLRLKLCDPGWMKVK